MTPSHLPPHNMPRVALFFGRFSLFRVGISQAACDWGGGKGSRTAVPGQVPPHIDQRLVVPSFRGGAVQAPEPLADLLERAILDHMPPDDFRIHGPQRRKSSLHVKLQVEGALYALRL